MGLISISDMCGHISGYCIVDLEKAMVEHKHTDIHTYTDRVHTWLHCSLWTEQVESGRLLDMGS